MSGFSDWLPWLCVAALPGITNIIVAFQELDRKCQLLPFFEPYTIPGVWLWAAIELVIPAASFWWMSSLSAKPAIDLNLLLKAATFGIGFAALLNSSTDPGSQPYQIKPIYTLLVRYAYDAIRSSQIRRAAEFWLDVENALHQTPALDQGLRFLEIYFELDATIAFEAGQSYADELNQAESTLDKPKQAKQIKSLLQKVKRRDLPNILIKFQFSEEFLSRYFSHRAIQASSDRSLRSIKATNAVI